MRPLPAIGLVLVFDCIAGVRLAAAAIDDQPGAPPPAAAPEKTPVLTRPPAVQEYVAPAYPASLAASGGAGEAVVLIDISASGTVDGVELVRASEPAFGEAALLAARRLTFVPALIDDVPAAIRIEYRYTFAPPPPPQPPAALPINFSGLVHEAGTRLPVANARLSIETAAVGGTDAEGRFALQGVAPGKVVVQVLHPDYDPYEVLEEISADARLEVKYYLLRKQRSPYETVVRSKQDRREVAKVQLTRQELEKVPGTFGDPVRVIENLPGMGRAPALGGQLLVRGANPADTQVFIDGMPIPLLYHFFALTSVMNSAFLDRIDFFPGGFGARYGRATAGAVDIVTRDLNCELWRGVAKVDIIDSAAFTCVPLGRWQVGAAARRSYVDLWLTPIIESIPRGPDQGSLSVSPVYYDYQAKAHAQSAAHGLDIFVIGSDDKLRFVSGGSLSNLSLSIGSHQGFHRLLVRDRWRIDQDVTLTSTVSPVYQINEFNISSSEVASSASKFGVNYVGVDWREDLALTFTPEVRLNAGIDHRVGQARVEFNFPVPTELTPFPTPVFDYTRIQHFDSHPWDTVQGYWGELVLDLPGHVRLVPGLRMDHFHFGEKGGAAAWLTSNDTLAIMPRAAVRWEFAPGQTAKAAWGRFARMPEPQFLLERLGNPGLRPERAQHFIVGYEHSLPELINIDAQLFYNLRTDLTAPSRSVALTGGQALSEVYANSGRGHTYGFELMLRRMPSPENVLYGWLAYTLSRSQRRDHPVGAAYHTASGDLPYDTDATAEYLSNFDQTHILTLVAQFLLPAGWEAGLRLRLISGNPTTPSERARTVYDADADQYNLDASSVPRNSGRMPMFKQLDVRVEKTFTFSLWRLTTYLELINATYAKNVESFSYDYRYRTKAAVTLLPILPNIGVKGEF